MVPATAYPELTKTSEVQSDVTAANDGGQPEPETISVPTIGAKPSPQQAHFTLEPEPFAESATMLLTEPPTDKSTKTDPPALTNLDKSLKEFGNTKTLARSANAIHHTLSLY